jgi:HK97 family phage prohead protease
MTNGQRGALNWKGATMLKIEKRYLTPNLRVEQRAEGEIAGLSGYAAVFNKRSVELWGFYEVLAPGVFADSLAAEDDVLALWNHDPNWILARSTNGSLRLKEDKVGLISEIDPLDTAINRGFVAAIERGDVTQMSFAFVATDERWDLDANEQWVRTILRAKLYDVSPVTYPAYLDTSIGVRSAGTMNPVFGYVPELPVELQRALQWDGQAGDALALERERRTRRLRLMGLK